MMNNSEFEQFVRENGRDILRFCRMTCGDRDSGDELYQDTMLGLLGKRKQLDTRQNVKSYALSMSILLWKNKKKKYANRNRLLPVESIDCMEKDGTLTIATMSDMSPENCIIQEDEKNTVQQIVANLPEKYRVPIHLYYAADLSVKPVGTGKMVFFPVPLAFFIFLIVFCAIFIYNQRILLILFSIQFTSRRGVNYFPNFL